MLVSLLSQAQQEELASAFRQFDLDSSGSIDRHELTHVLRQLGLGPAEGAVKAIIASLDVDGDGKIQWREFSALMADRWLGQEGRVDIQHAASEFANDNGLLDVGNMCKLMSSVGERPLDPTELAEFRQLMDPQGTGVIGVDAFTRIGCWEPPDLNQLRQMSHERTAELERLANTPVTLAPS